MVRNHAIKSAFIVAIVFCLSACEPKDNAAPTAGAIAETGSFSARAAAAVANTARPDADRADDAMRKPTDVLTFIEVSRGANVFEMEAGGGYYTELISALVGPDGEVVMHNPESFDAFLGDSVATRIDGRLNNVRRTKSAFDKLDANDASMDVVTWMLGPHDLYYTPAGDWPVSDEAGSYEEAFRILKPGGVFIVLDHMAAPGSPKTTGGTVHRIDSAIVVALAEAAGFTLAGESDVLRNADDNYDAIVFDPLVRRKTDRFLLKFKKPE